MNFFNSNPKKSYIMVFISIILIILIVFIITSLLCGNKNKISENSVTQNNINNKNNESILSNKNTAKIEENDDNEEIKNIEPELYITVNGKTIMADSKKQDWFYEENTPRIYKNDFNSLWEEINCEVIEMKVSDYFISNMQLSRYGYARDDKIINISQKIFYYETGTNGILYSIKQSGTKFNREYIIDDDNVGRSIHVLNIGDKWYTYKLLVTE